MKKFIMNDNWEMEAYDDHSDLFLLVVERSLPDCSYVYKYDTDPDALRPEYTQLTNQYKETDVDGPLNICIVRVPNTEQVNSQICCADSENVGTTEEAIEAINAVLNRADCEFLESWHKEPLTEKRHKRRTKQPYDSITYTTGYPELNMNFFNNKFGTNDLGVMDSASNESCGEGDVSCSESLTEAKREIKRYYVRPFNIFAANKAEILKILADNKESNCSVYSLKALDDHDDVHLLQPSDIIYYYDEGVLYDKNHVQVLDYDLRAKAEEERKKFATIDDNSDSFKAEYEDRMTSATDLDEYNESLNENLREDINTCIICGEEFKDYGHNPWPVAEEGRCCSACNAKFVIPARIEASKKAYEED